MTKQELDRAKSIGRCLRTEIRQAEAGEPLGLSERRIRHLVKRVRTAGIRSRMHKNRGRESQGQMSPEPESRIGSIIGEPHADFMPFHAAEKLQERHRIRVSRQKIRELMTAPRGCGGDGGGGRPTMSGGRASHIPVCGSLLQNSLFRRRSLQRSGLVTKRPFGAHSP
jgi:hypothetical protein